MPGAEFSTTVDAFLEGRRDHSGSNQAVVSLLERCCFLYERRGLLPGGKDEPLKRICAHGVDCWDDNEPRCPERAGVSAPWIGDRYADRRICVIGMNFDDWGGLNGHWEATAWHIEAMRHGQPGKNGTLFAAGAMSYVAAVDAAMDGDLSVHWEPAPYVQLADMWQSCAFLQTVKCSPAGNRSNPYAAMFQNCPSFLLREELEILAPEVVLVLGRESGPRDAIRPLLQVGWGTHPGHLERDSFQLSSGGRSTLFSCNHPATQNRGHWRLSLERLVESLLTEPL